MRRRLQVGDSVHLPGGRTVILTLPAEPYRPWMLQASGTLWQLKREHSPSLVHRSPWQHYAGDDGCPLRLSERDARALADALNEVIPRRPVSLRVAVRAGSAARLHA
ncbi:MAG TPA: hypothetical protein VHM00_02670 [Caldimonas sp.]|jgi:hypothetical protein|nr:hypothetical protein [Caldimonas sp.]HEX2539965.1 hypothetical protein [Caldimonas sp.]